MTTASWHKQVSTERVISLVINARNIQGGSIRIKAWGQTHAEYQQKMIQMVRVSWEGPFYAQPSQDDVSPQDLIDLIGEV